MVLDDADDGGGRSGLTIATPSPEQSTSAAMAALAALAAGGERVMQGRLKELSAGNRCASTTTHASAGVVAHSANAMNADAQPPGEKLFTNNKSCPPAVTSITKTDAQPSAEKTDAQSSGEKLFTNNRSSSSSGAPRRKTGAKRRKPANSSCSDEEKESDPEGPNGQDDRSFATVASRKSKKTALRENRELEKLKQEVQSQSVGVFKVVLRRESTEPNQKGVFREGTLLKMFKEIHDAFPACKVSGGTDGIVVWAPAWKLPSPL